MLRWRYSSGRKVQLATLQLSLYILFDGTPREYLIQMLRLPCDILFLVANELPRPDQLELMATCGRLSAVKPRLDREWHGLDARWEANKCDLTLVRYVFRSLDLRRIRKVLEFFVTGKQSGLFYGGVSEVYNVIDMLYELSGQLLCRLSVQKRLMRRRVRVDNLPCFSNQWTIRSLLSMYATWICVDDQNERPVYLELVDWTALLDHLTCRYGNCFGGFNIIRNSRRANWLGNTQGVLLHMERRGIAIKVRELRSKNTPFLRGYVPSDLSPLDLEEEGLFWEWLRTRLPKYHKVFIEAGSPGRYTEKTAFREVARLIKSGHSDERADYLIDKYRLYPKYERRLDALKRTYREKESLKPRPRFQVSEEFLERAQSAWMTSAIHP